MSGESSQENPESFEAYSPMDVSPYQETLAENTYSRETSVASDDASHFGDNYASSESLPTVTNDSIGEDLIIATHRLGISEGHVKCSGKRDGVSENNFNKGVGAEGFFEESVSGAETESFKSAAEHLDYSSDTFVTAVDADLNSTATTERQDTDDTAQFTFASNAEDIGRSSFTFAASSSIQGQSSTETRHHKKKHRQKIGQDSYSSTPNAKISYASSSVELFPVSGSSTLLSPRQGKKGDASTFLSRNRDKSEPVKEQDKEKKVPTSAASTAAQEACEKWRLRGNQAYGSGDLSKAEDYYTQGVNSVSQSETSRGCLRALMLCYSNRAATRMSLGRMREALKDCLMAAGLDPNFLRVQVRAANCYLAVGEVENALLHFTRCLQSGSDVCVDRKILVEASEGLEKAQKVSDCITQSAELLRKKTPEDVECALKFIDEALRISSCSEKLLEMKADALLMLRKYEQVIQLCEQTLTSAEMNSPAYEGEKISSSGDGSDLPRSSSSKIWRLGLIVKSYFYLGRLEEALDFVKKQEDSDPLMGSRGSMRLESAIPLADTVRELLSHKAAGNEAFQSGRHAEAVEQYTAALSCNVESRPFAAICFCNRAAAYRAMGQITDAIADCSLAIALDGTYLKAISRRASLFEMIRDYGQAAIDYRRLVTLLTKQVEEKGNQSGASDKLSYVNELRQNQQRLSFVEEEDRKEIPLNMYLILGVEPSAAASEIKKAYRKAALKHHPDKAGQSLARSENVDDGLWREIADEVHKDTDRLFKMIGEAYAVLSNPTKRSRYDLDEEMRNEPNRFTGSGTSRMYADAQNYPFERSGSRRQWQEVWRQYETSQSRGSERTRPSRYP